MNGGYARDRPLEVGFHEPSVFFSSLCFRLAFLVAPALLAQSGPMPPPPLMLFVREEVKPGHGAGHAATESACGRGLAKGKSTDHYLGMSAPDGALRRPGSSWATRSYADWEAKQGEFDKNPALKKEIDKISQQDGEHLTSTRTFLGTCRKDLSFGPPVEIGKMRYMRVRTFRVKQGRPRPSRTGVKTPWPPTRRATIPASFAFYEVGPAPGHPPSWCCGP